MGWIMDMRVRLVSPSPVLTLGGGGDEEWRGMMSRVVSFGNRLCFDGCVGTKLIGLSLFEPPHEQQAPQY